MHIQKALFICLLLTVLNQSAFAQKEFEIDTGLDVLHSDERTSLRIQFAYLHKIAPKFSAGLGSGYTHYDDPLSLIPVFINLKLDLHRGNIIPFLFLKSGYSFSILTDKNFDVDDHEGGWLFNPGVGIQFATKSDVSLYINTGFNLNHSQFKNEVFGNSTATNKITYKRLLVGVGLIF